MTDAQLPPGIVPRIVQISGVAHATSSLRQQLGMVLPSPEVPLPVAMAADLAIDGLARLLTSAIETCTTTDGRLDMRDVAGHVLVAMGENRKSDDGPDVGRVSTFVLAEQALARLLTEAFEKRQQPDGRVDTRDVAAYVFSQMRSQR